MSAVQRHETDLGGSKFPVDEDRDGPSNVDLLTI
jgi:hypothetical protein